MKPDTIYELLAYNLPDRARHSAVIEKDCEMTYSQLCQKCEAVAGYLFKCGIKNRDRIGIHLRKSPEEIISFFATARIGAVSVNINYQWTIHQLQYIVKDCGIRILFTDRRKAKLVLENGLIDSLELIITTDAPPEHSKIISLAQTQNDRKAPNTKIDKNELAALVYTSGSTGKPKGVMLSHLNIILSAESVVEHLKNIPEDRVLGLLPMSFDYGI